MEKEFRMPDLGRGEDRRGEKRMQQRGKNAKR
jgi:hypothetical protein